MDMSYFQAQISFLCYEYLIIGLGQVVLRLLEPMSRSILDSLTSIIELPFHANPPMIKKK